MRITPVNESRAEEGNWVEYLGVPLKIARSNSKAFKKSFRRLSKPYDKQIRNNKLDPETSERIMCRALAEAVLVDWDQEKFPGKIPYSVDAAEELLTNDTDCRDFVNEYAADAENYYEDDEEEKVESLKKVSSGKLNSAA